MPTFAKGEVWGVVEKIIPHTHRMLLYGPSGTGKTHSGTLGQKMVDEKVFQITMTPDTPASALIGHFIIKDNNCLWIDGVGIMAWRHSHVAPTRLVINEVDHSGPDAVSALHVLLDDHTTAGFTLPTEEHVTPGAKLKVIGTMNGKPEDLLPSLQDRFAVRINIDEVHPQAILTLPEDIRKLAQGTAMTTDPQRRVSIRSWHAFASMRSSMKSGGVAEAEAETLAAKVVFGDRWLELTDALKLGRTPHVS